MTYEQVQEAWKLCDAARDFSKQANRDVPLQEIIDKIFIPSGIVDEERTNKEKSANPLKIYLKSPYGVEFRADLKIWAPFRHGPV
jgi:hypothetical protein